MYRGKEDNYGGLSARIVLDVYEYVCRNCGIRAPPTIEYSLSFPGMVSMYMYLLTLLQRIETTKKFERNYFLICSRKLRLYSYNCSSSGIIAAPFPCSSSQYTYISGCCFGWVLRWSKTSPALIPTAARLDIYFKAFLLFFQIYNIRGKS